nr:nitric oxide synthase-interacting protein [Ipomoea batatas]
MLQKAREIDAFDQQNHSAVPQYNDKSYSVDKNGIHGANSVKATSYEEEALRTMSVLAAFCHARSSEDTSEQKKTSSLDKSYICPSCKVTLTNTLALVAINTCGHVFCKKCANKFVVADKVCLVCGRPCKDKNVVNLEKRGTGFAAHGDNLEA